MVGTVELVAKNTFLSDQQPMLSWLNSETCDLISLPELPSNVGSFSRFSNQEIERSKVEIDKQKLQNIYSCGQLTVVFPFYV